MKKVSILIPLYNAEKFVAETLECCLAQTYPNIEVIVMDDGSTDGSFAVAKKYESDKIHVYHQENAGGCRARNLAFEKSSGDYIMYLDADDVMSSNKVEVQVKRLEEVNDTNAIATCPWQEFYTTTNVEFTSQPCYKDYDDPITLLTDIWTKDTMLAVTCYLTSRELIQAAGPWDERLTKNQDGEFFCRVLCKASKVLYCEDTKFYYRRGHESVSTGGRLSLAKIQSALDSRICYEETILPLRDNKVVRHGLAKNYSNIMFNSYVGSSCYNEAKHRIMALGEKSEHPSAKGIKALIIKMIGYENYLKFKESKECNK